MKLSANQHWPNQLEPDKAEKYISQGREKFKPSFYTDFLTDEVFQSCEAWSEQTQNSDLLIVIGMGGSSLGGIALQKFIQPKKRVIFLEGFHPRSVAQTKSAIQEAKDTTLLFISKSGKTLESLINFNEVVNLVPKEKQYYVTSNAGVVSTINGAAQEKIFLIHEELGGRFSIVSPVGVLPGLFMGADMKAFMAGFKKALNKWGFETAIESNSIKKLAASYHKLLGESFNGIVFWSYASELQAFTAWLQQLWGESLGKNSNTKVLPFICKGPEDQHSMLQFFLDGPNLYAHTFFHSTDYGNYDKKAESNLQGNFEGHNLSTILKAQMQSIELALTENNRPCFEFDIQNLYQGSNANEEALGELMGASMLLVTYLGYLYEINAFDQPAVETGKTYCHKILTEGLDSAMSSFA